MVLRKTIWETVIVPRRGGSRKDRTFKVSLRMPEGMSEDSVMDYIEEAVCGWVKGLPLDHPIRDIDTNTVTVKRNTPKYAEMNP